MTIQSTTSTTIGATTPMRSSSTASPIAEQPSPGHSGNAQPGSVDSDLPHVPVQWRVFLGTMLAVLLLNALIYLPRINAPFVFDSLNVIRANTELEQWNVGGSRWLAMASFALDRSLYGLDVRGYHATSIAVHLVTTALVFWTLYVVLGNGTWSTRLSSTRLQIAAFTALLWSVHPLQTQAVLYTVQRMETLMALFFLASLLLFSIGLQAKLSVPYLLGAAACYYASASCKEVAIAIPTVLLIYDFMTTSGSSLGARVALMVKRRAWFYTVLLLLSFAFLPSLRLITERMPDVAFTRAEVTEETLQTTGTDVVDVAGVTPTDYLLTQPKVITRYLALAIFPRGQNIDHAVEISQSSSDRTIYPIALALFAIFTVVAISKSWIVGFAGAVFLLVLAPTSSIVPIRDLMVEHRMYLPLVPIIAVICGAWFGSVSNGRLTIAIAVLACLLLTGVSIARASVYRSGVALWKDATQKNPANPRAFAYLGGHQYEEQKLQDSIESYERAIALAEARTRIPTLIRNEEMRQSLSRVQNNFAVVLTRNTNYSGAKRVLEQSVANDPQNAAAHSSLGNVYARLGDNPRAISSYEAALRIDPNMDAAKRNLATISASVNSSAKE